MMKRVLEIPHLRRYLMICADLKFHIEFHRYLPVEKDITTSIMNFPVIIETDIIYQTSTFPSGSYSLWSAWDWRILQCLHH
jgi:hypothetical protein